MIPYEKDVLRTSGSTVATKLLPATAERSYEGNWPNKYWDIIKSIVMNRFIPSIHKKY